MNGNNAYLDHTTVDGTSKPVGPIWNPEVFFDVAVVNGYAWPKHEVRPNRYRLRLLNACDSRTLSLSAWAWPADKAAPPASFDELFQDGGEEVPIWVIGTEQSLLSGGPAKVQLGSVEKYNCDDGNPTFDDPAPAPLQGESIEWAFPLSNSFQIETNT